jgi:lactocepin
VDKTKPEVHMLTPKYLGVSDSKDVKVSGYVTDKSGVRSFEVNGKAVKLTYDSRKDQYLFNTTIHYTKDGVYDIQAAAVDGAGNKGEISQRFLLDSTAPKVSLSDAHYVKSYVNSIHLSIGVSDAFDGVRVYLDDDEIYHHNLSSPYRVTNFKKSISADLKLSSGHNIHTVKVVDTAGHTTTTTFDVYKTSRSPKYYKDVSSSHWAFEEINTLSVMGILTGGTSTMFEPAKDVTRLDAAKMMVRALGLSTSNLPAPKYSDISKLKKSDPEGYKAIAALTDEGLMSGSKGKFNPQGSLTRGELAKLLVQAFELEGSASQTFKDVKKGSLFAPYVSIAVSNHVMNPYKDGSFNVSKKVTRADFALYLARVLDDRFK